MLMGLGFGTRTYVFQVEKYGVEAEEHKANGGGEPAKRSVSESVHINPDFLVHPSLWFSVLVMRVLDETNGETLG